MPSKVARSLIIQMIKINVNNSRLCKVALHLATTRNNMVIITFFVSLYSNIEDARSVVEYV